MGHLAKGGIQNSYSFPVAASGRIVTGITRIRFPNIPCEQVFFKAPSANTGTVYIGGSTVNSSTGMALQPGEFSPWIPVQNLDLIWGVAADATSYLLYFMIK
jgi:hypothetical protein